MKLTDKYKVKCAFSELTRSLMLISGRHDLHRDELTAQWAEVYPSPDLPEPPPPQPDTINYGLLYNWYAVDDARNIAAEGWGVPTDAELTTLTTHLGGASVAGGKLKETAPTWWDAPNTGATNEFGFNGRGAGYRAASDGTFIALKTNLQVLAKNQRNATQSWLRILASGDSVFTLGSPNKPQGCSLRLLRSTPYDAGTDGVLADGDAAYPYTGNDGKVYRTVKIGTQIWLADNLAETKWRTGAYIQGWGSGGYEVIGNAAWAALTTAALCVYDNDETNI
jgi:uncharacterized protein (TIGR02145 family)